MLLVFLLLCGYSRCVPVEFWSGEREEGTHDLACLSTVMTIVWSGEGGRGRGWTMSREVSRSAQLFVPEVRDGG